MKTQKGSTIIIVLVIVLIFLIGLYVLLMNAQKTVPAPATENPQEQLILESNTQIKYAMKKFKTVVDVRKGTEIAGLFCTGGFINETEPELKGVASTIVDNRIINTMPLEYAKTQDEAGITCLGSAEEWVLFSALNAQSTNDDKHYWCVDSTGAEGSYGYDSETFRCLTGEEI